MTGKRKSISSAFLISFLTVILLSLILQTGFWVKNIYTINAIQKEQIEKEYLQFHKNVIKHEVNEVTRSIDEIRAEVRQRLKESLRKQISIAKNIATEISSRSTGIQDRAAIQNLILAASIPVLEMDEKRLIIIGTTEGNILFLKDHGTGDKDTPAARTAFRKIADTFRKSGEGYSSWQNNCSFNGRHDNTVFIGIFEPLQLLIVTGFYLEDMENTAKKQSLEIISSASYGPDGEGYLFALQYNGLYISHPSAQYVGMNLINLTDPNGVAINRKIIQTCKEGGGFVEYAWDRPQTGRPVGKISYVKGYPPWQWAIGTGFYLDDMQQVIATQKNILQNQLEALFFKIGLFSLAIFILSGILTKLIVNRLNTELKTFHRFFNTPTDQSHAIDLEDIRYKEFHQLAQNANSMLSDRLAMEEALVQSEKRFRHLIADLPQIAVQGYNSKREVIYWNRASETLYGYSEQEAMGQKLEDLIIPEQMKDAVIGAIHGWLSHGVAIPSAELNLKHKNGTTVPVYSSHVMLVTNRGVKEMYCIDLDLSELKAAQEMKQKSELFYRQLFDHSSSGVVVYEAVDNGENFIIKDLNRASEKIDNCRREEMIGKTVTAGFPGIEEFGLLDVFRKVWQTGRPAFHPVSFYTDDKTQGWRENRVYKLQTGEIVAVYDDVTEQKQLEDEKRKVEMQLHQAQKMEAIGLMAGGVAHDLNNILTGITGYPELLLLKLPGESDLRQPIEAIKESGERAAAVVADLLTVARGVACTKTNASINALITEYFSSPEWLQLQSSNQHIQYIQRLSEGLPPIFCSPVHIKKCIMNLVTNGIEAMTGAGSITISTEKTILTPQLRQELRLKEGEYVVLTVSDTGTGISDTDIKHIFEPFYSKKEMGRSGTGLGLAVVWNTMEDHQGRITVSSAQGTTFTLYFPASTEGDTAPSTPPEPEEVPTSNARILVVDDEPVLQDIATQMLQNKGYTVDSVGSGEEAVSFVKEHSVDLIVMDMLMEPGMNGYETYKEILKIRPDQKIIIASGFSESDDVKAALDLGASAFIKKPYTMNSLSKGIHEALKQ